MATRVQRGTPSKKRSMSAKRKQISFSPNFDTLEEQSCDREQETTEFSYNQRRVSRARNSQTLSHIQIKDSKGKKPRFPQTPKSSISHSRGLSQKSQKNKSLTLTRGESTERSRSESRRKCYACTREDKKLTSTGTIRRCSTAEGTRRESGKLWKRQLVNLGRNVIRYLREERNELLKMKEEFKYTASSIEEELVNALNCLSENIEKVGSEIQTSARRRRLKRETSSGDGREISKSVWENETTDAGDLNKQISQKAMGGGFYENEVEVVTYPSPPKKAKKQEASGQEKKEKPSEEQKQ